MKRNQTLVRGMAFTHAERRAARRGTKSCTRWRLMGRNSPRVVPNRTVALASTKQWKAALKCWGGMRPASGRVVRALVRQIEADVQARLDEGSFA